MDVGRERGREGEGGGERWGRKERRAMMERLASGGCKNG